LVEYNTGAKIKPQHRLSIRGFDFCDKVVTLFTGRGTNDGDFGEYPATGTKIETPMCEVVYFNDDGKLTAGELYYDLMTMLMQLGHIKEPAKQ